MRRAAVASLVVAAAIVACARSNEDAASSTSFHTVACMAGVPSTNDGGTFTFDQLPVGRCTDEGAECITPVINCNLPTGACGGTYRCRCTGGTWSCTADALDRCVCPPQARDGSVVVVPPSSTNACPGDAPTAADLEQAGGWKPPTPAKGACTEGDLATFGANLNTAQTYLDLVKNVSPACTTCILSKQTDARWQYVVTDTSGQAGFFDYGACYAVKTTEACAKALQYEQFCLSVACSTCADAQFAACKKAKSTTAACDANFGPAIRAACETDAGADVLALHAACDDATSGVRALCGP